MEEGAGETRIPNPTASRPNGQGNDFDMLPTWAWRLTLAWVARGPLKVARECDPGMRQEFASENKPKTGSNASVSLTKRTPFNRGAGKSLNIVFSRGLRAARTGGVVAAIPFACHTVRRRQRKNLLPNNPPLGFSLGTVTTTETLSTEATPEHHRGCFNAPHFPVTLDSDLPSSPTTIANPQPIRHTRPTPVIPDHHREPATHPSYPTTHPSYPAHAGTHQTVISDAHSPSSPTTHPSPPTTHPSSPTTHPSSPTPIGDLPPHPRTRSGIYTWICQDRTSPCPPS